MTARALLGRCSLQSPQFVDAARQPRMLRIADVELIPACDVTPAVLPEQELEPHAEALEESGGADHVFNDCPIASLLLGAKLLGPSDRLIVARQHLTAEQPIETQLAIRRVFGRLGRARVHEAPGMALT